MPDKNAPDGKELDPRFNELHKALDTVKEVVKAPEIVKGQDRSMKTSGKPNLEALAGVKPNDGIVIPPASKLSLWDKFKKNYLAPALITGVAIAGAVGLYSIVHNYNPKAVDNNSTRQPTQIVQPYNPITSTPTVEFTKPITPTEFNPIEPIEIPNPITSTPTIEETNPITPTINIENPVTPTITIETPVTPTKIVKPIKPIEPVKKPITNTQITKLELPKKITGTAYAQFGIGDASQGRFNGRLETKDLIYNLSYLGETREKDLDLGGKDKEDLGGIYFRIEGTDKNKSSLEINKAIENKDIKRRSTGSSRYPGYTQFTDGNSEEEDCSRITSLKYMQKLGKTNKTDLTIRHSYKSDTVKTNGEENNFLDFDTLPDLSLNTRYRTNSKTIENTLGADVAHDFGKLTAGLMFKTKRTDVEAGAKVDGASVLDYSERFNINSVGAFIDTKDENGTNWRRIVARINSGENIEKKYKLDGALSYVNCETPDFPGIGLGYQRADGVNYGILGLSFGGSPKEKVANLESVFNTMEDNNLNPEGWLKEQRYFKAYDNFKSGNKGTSVLLMKGTGKDYGAMVTSNFTDELGITADYNVENLDVGGLNRQTTTLSVEPRISLSKKLFITPRYVLENEKWNNKNSRESIYSIGLGVGF